MDVQDQIFFTLKNIKTMDHGFTCESWEIPPTLFYFEGHFPHFPVLPAVAIVDISLALLKTAQPETTWKLLAVPSAKFMQPVGPSRRVKIVATKEAGAGEWSIEWLDANTLDVTAQLRLHLGC